MTFSHNSPSILSFLFFQPWFEGNIARTIIVQSRQQTNLTIDSLNLLIGDNALDRISNVAFLHLSGTCVCFSIFAFQKLFSLFLIMQFLFFLSSKFLSMLKHLQTVILLPNNLPLCLIIFTCFFNNAKWWELNQICKKQFE